MGSAVEFTIWLFNSLPWKITMLLRTVNHLFLWAIEKPWRTVRHHRMLHVSHLPEVNHSCDRLRSLTTRWQASWPDLGQIAGVEGTLEHLTQAWKNTQLERTPNRTKVERLARKIENNLHILHGIPWLFAQTAFFWSARLGGGLLRRFVTTL